MLFVHPFFGNGGAEKSISILSTTLTDKDWIVDLFTLVIDPNSLCKSFKNIYVSPASSSKYSIPMLFRVLLRNKYDFVVINQAFAISTYNIPLFLLRTLFGLKFSIISFERLSPESFLKNSRLFSFIHHKLYYLSLLVSDKIMANSYEQIFEYGKSFKSKIISYIPNSSDFISAAALQHDPISKNILWMGRLAEIKRPYIALDVLNILPYDWNLYIAGDGPLRSTLVNEVTSKSLTGRVFFGTINDFKSIQFNHLLHTSSHEGLPNSILESLSSGLPVVSTQFRTGLLELFIPGWLSISTSDLPSQIVDTIKLSNSSKFTKVRDKTDITGLIKLHYNINNMSSAFQRALQSTT